MTPPETLILHETAHPDRPLLFFLDGDTFSMDLTAAFSPALPEPGAPPKEPIELWAEGLALKIIAPFSEPTHVRDVLFDVQGNQVTLQIWKRLRGMRLAPAAIGLGSIDDPQAAQTFADLLKARAAAAEHPGRFPGLLDYWGAWALMGAGVVTAAYSLYRLFIRHSRDR